MSLFFFFCFPFVSLCPSLFLFVFSFFSGGKGRTGLIIVCYLFFCGMYSEVDKCLEHFARARSAKGKGVTQPSQLRYARYFCGIVSNKLGILYKWRDGRRRAGREGRGGGGK